MLLIGRYSAVVVAIVVVNPLTPHGTLTYRGPAHLLRVVRVSWAVDLHTSLFLGFD